jgi:hypothetical protein
MQLELRTIIHKTTEMEATLSEILAGIEGRHKVELAPYNAPMLAKPEQKRYGFRGTPKARKKASEQMKAYWASPKGRERKTKGNSRRVTNDDGAVAGS